MEILRGIYGSPSLDRTLPYPVVTIGNFDGVHLGHQQIIGLAIQKARAHQGTAIVFTFRPHPQVALKPDSNVQLLSTYDEKLELLNGLGVDVVVEEPFSREFSTISPQEFFNEVLLRKLHAREIVVGYDFAFGKERQGHLDVLGAFCKSAEVELTVVSPQRVQNEVVSSSRVRQHLAAGDIEAANRLLGRRFSYKGSVIRGDGRGRKIGFPTANLKLETKLALPYGVYATVATCEGKEYPSVTNVGVRPTFAQPSADGVKEMPALVETHLLDTTVDLYGRTLEVSFVKRIREERKFSGVDELKAQIQRDVESARQSLPR